MELESSLSSLFFIKSSDDLSHSVSKDWKFWCIIVSLALSILLTAVEFVGHLTHLSSFLYLFLVKAVEHDNLIHHM